MGSILIRELVYGDLDEVVKVHMASFHDRALTQLGKEAVKRYYDIVLKDYQISYPICAVKNEGVICGFCFAGLYPNALSKFLRTNKGFLLSCIILHPWLITKSVIRQQLWLAIRLFFTQYGKDTEYKGNTSNTNPDSPNNHGNSYLGILSIAVHPSYQRKGIGELLLKRSEDIAIEHNFQNLRLTVHPQNLPAVRFYEKTGWEKIHTEGQWEGQMMKSIVK